MNADAISRLSTGEAVRIPECDGGMFLCSFLEEIPIEAKDKREARFYFALSFEVCHGELAMMSRPVLT